MQHQHSIRINLKGGILPLNELFKVTEVLKSFKIRHLSFGLRQQIIIKIPKGLIAATERKLKEKGLFYQIDTNSYPNIVSSFAGEEIFQNGTWLTEGHYKDLLDGFDFEPSLKVNISDFGQSLSPYYSGHLNFIASQLPQLWHLAIRFPKTNEVIHYHQLIQSKDLAKLVGYFEESLATNNANQQQILAEIPIQFRSQSVVAGLKTHEFRLPYYEGLNRYGAKTWLGIYRRDEQFSIDFLEEVGQLCLATKIGQLSLSPWKSLIVKGINESDRMKWSKLLAKHSINVRHAANELNWQIEDDSEEALGLKQALVRYLDSHDLRTFGLCFGIKTRPKTEVFASVMIRKNPLKFLGILPLGATYDITYTQDFDPNGRTKIYFATGILKIHLAEQLRRAVLLFHQKTAKDEIQLLDNEPKKPQTEDQLSALPVMQCSVCKSKYDPRFGDEFNQIEIGVLFDNLPASYQCSLCESPKEVFELLV